MMWGPHLKAEPQVRAAYEMKEKYEDSEMRIGNIKYERHAEAWNLNALPLATSALVHLKEPFR